MVPVFQTASSPHLVIEGGYLRVPWTLLVRMAEFSNSELRLLLSVLMHTIGWHRLEAPVAHSIISRETGLHQTSIRRALLSLKEKEIIDVSQRILNGRELNVFQIRLPAAVPKKPPAEKSAAAAERPDLQNATLPAEATVGEGTPCALHGDPMQSACHENKVPSNEGKKEQQQSRIPATRRVRRPAAANPTPHPAAVFSELDLNEDQVILLQRMRDVGVGRTIALRLVGEAPVEVIRTALDNLPYRHAKRPAALLVKEIQDGGWETPRELLELQQREEAELQKRIVEEETARASEVQAAAEEEAFEERWAALSAPARVQVLEAARRRISWAAHLPEAFEEDGPLMRGAIREVVAELPEGFDVATEVDCTPLALPNEGEPEERPMGADEVVVGVSPELASGVGEALLEPNVTCTPQVISVGPSAPVLEVVAGLEDASPGEGRVGETVGEAEGLLPERPEAGELHRVGQGAVQLESHPSRLAGGAYLNTEAHFEVRWTPRELLDRQQREEVELQKRVVEEEKVRAAEAQASAEEKAFEERWAALSASARVQVVEAARRRISWAAHLPGALEEDSPLMRGAIREVVAEDVVVSPGLAGGVGEVLLDPDVTCTQQQRDPAVAGLEEGFERGPVVLGPGDDGRFAGQGRAGETEGLLRGLLKVEAVLAGSQPGVCQALFGPVDLGEGRAGKLLGLHDLGIGRGGVQLELHPAQLAGIADPNMEAPPLVRSPFEGQRGELDVGRDLDVDLEIPAADPLEPFGEAQVPNRAGAPEHHGALQPTLGDDELPLQGLFRGAGLLRLEQVLLGGVGVAANQVRSREGGGSRRRRSRVGWTRPGTASERSCGKMAV